MTLPLEDYALIGDGQTAALVSREGSIDWLCWPRFDSAACFASLLGKPEHGCWSIRPENPPAGGASAIGRRYQPDTLIVETDLAGQDGTVRLIDFMPMHSDRSSLVRVVQGLNGRPGLRMSLNLKLDYGALPPWTETIEHGFVARIGPDLVALHSSVPIRLDSDVAEASFTITEGQQLTFVLRYGASHEPAPHRIDPIAALNETSSGAIGSDVSTANERAGRIQSNAHSLL